MSTILMIKRFATLKLTDKQKTFLRDYCPEDDWCTTDAEMAAVEDALGLEKLTDTDVAAMRNSVVEFYRIRREALMGENDTWTDAAYNASTAMMSVTAVIDHVKYKRGMEV